MLLRVLFQKSPEPSFANTLLALEGCICGQVLRVDLKVTLDFSSKQVAGQLLCPGPTILCVKRFRLTCVG